MTLLEWVIILAALLAIALFHQTALIVAIVAVIIVIAVKVYQMTRPARTP